MSEDPRAGTGAYAIDAAITAGDAYRFVQERAEALEGDPK